ncbi:uncharacterized protein [Lolium perenne]|uniref:uncharacterized protein n=1 Tax=Lolium perenne TaxID=4522 RepID=UPI0021F50BAD|nr:COPII coat assembly protein SEC16-like [Lolium perenne]
MDLGLGLRRRRDMSPQRRNGAPDRDHIASDDQGPPSPSPAPPSARSHHLRSLVSRIRRYSGRVPPTGPAFQTALPAVGHLSLHQADHPADAPAAPTASALDSTALDSRALPTSPAAPSADHLGPSADHQVRTLPRLQTSDYDIRGPDAPVVPALYSVGLVMSPAPSAGDSRSYAYAADYSHRGGLDSTPTSPTASPEALNKARFTRDNVLYAFSFLCLHTIHRNMKDIEDAWYAGFKEFFILMMVVCFGMIGVGVMANTSTPMSETNNMISAMLVHLGS